MARTGKEIDRATIARAALELIDREGLDALSMRHVAAELGVDPMMLYRSVPNREGMLRDVVSLLFEEIDLSEQPGETWDETLMRMHRSERAMALRHPHALQIVVLAPRDEEPVLSFARRLRDLLAKGGLPEGRFFDVWLVDASFTNGFLLLETATLARRAAAEGADAGMAPGAGELAGGLAGTLTGDAFERGLALIYRGLKETFASEGEG